MARARYFVVQNQGEWKISFDDKHYGPYKTQAAAIQAAVDAATSSGKKGDDAQVLVQSIHPHQFRTEWTYGNDP